jgi:hypothetical protein
VTFRRDGEVLACLRRWREQCLAWCCEIPDDGRCADQRYLDEWPERYQGARVLGHPGAGLGPWNLADCRLSAEQGKLLVDGAPLVFYHFSRLRAVCRWLYEPSLWRYGATMHPVAKRQLYAPYVRELQRARRSIRMSGGQADPPDNVDEVGARFRQLRLLGEMLPHRSFLLVVRSLVL